ncbi:MAG: 50S ribosomal protein L22 [Deltaproteobacteria bacterium]|nr:50S ribosomal protein L22 [Deltaproteobacteria bacterium]MBW2253179.1 50S ribosomal protein L22 [Deltaproteobacteria bacterium]
MNSRAVLRRVGVAPRKARLVADLVRGRDVSEALEVLQFTQKKAAGLIRKLVESAVANAEHVADRTGEDLDVDDLFIETIFVDAGPRLRRYRPRAHGRATKILKKTSHITVVLETR